ncbi:MAG: hypothetical protein ACTTKC_05025 [Treponema sp.]|uniref:hypothetical protein n=1 Tax=Treponema sp. TaxID=166 RepID=UPI003FA30E73
MNEKEYHFQVLDLKISQAIALIKENREIEAKKDFADKLPEWITLETAVKLKGGGALETYKTSLFLQPCCGTNSASVCGRKSWKKSDVIEWLEITDHTLKSYADRFGVTIPAHYVKRSKQ